MSINGKENRFKISDRTETAGVDVTPMMNIMIILLVMLISMSVFTRITVLSFSLPPNVGKELSNDSGKPKLKMTVVVTPEYCALTFGEKMLDSIPMTGNTNDFTMLKERIVYRKTSEYLENEAIVAVRDKVRFQAMVKVMDICRDCGFEKIGVSNATDNADSGV